MRQTGIAEDAQTISGYIRAARWQPSSMPEVMGLYACVLRDNPALLDQHVYSALFSTAYHSGCQDAAWLLQVEPGPREGPYAINECDPEHCSCIMLRSYTQSS